MTSTSMRSLILGLLLGMCAVEWVGCGRANESDGCPLGDCAGASSTPTCAAGACAGATSTPDCGASGCGGGPSDHDCAGSECAGAGALGGAPTTTDCPGGHCAGAPNDCGGMGCGGAPVGPECDGGGAGCAGAVCEPNAFRCAGSELRRCTSDGASEVAYQACGNDEYCDAQRGLCVARVCEPNAVGCDGANVMGCNEDGTAESLVKSCSLTQLCSAGACRDIVCVPNTRYCAGKDVWRCSADGTSATLTKHCASAQFCLEDDGSADCSATECVPGAPICAGALATQCAADGSGPEPGGDDCAALGGACYEGECRDLACTPGRKLCDHDDVYLCTENGTATALFSECVDGSEYCDPDAPACRTRVCTPGAQGCDGTRVATCDELGAGFVASGKDCDSLGQVCVAGSCKAVVCSATAYFCKQGDVFLCDSTGTGSTLSQTCQPGASHCVSFSNFGYCASNQCVPNANGCNGDVISTCNADGSGWASSGTNCAATGQRCQDGGCVALVCTPYAAFCSENHKRQCDWNGLNFSDYGACEAGTYCVEQGNNVACQPTPCSAGAVGCLSEKLGTCASDGMSLASVASDCGAQSKLCTPQGCAAQALDIVGASDQIGLPSGTVMGDIVRVQSARTLTQIEAYLSLAASRALTWVIYEAVDASSYRLLFSAGTTGTGAGFQSSGPISYGLRAGKTYFIGVGVTGSYVAYYGNTADQKPLSFGVALGTGAASATSDTIYTATVPYQLYYFRLTTKP